MTLLSVSRFLKMLSLSILTFFISCNISKTGIDKFVSMRSFYIDGTNLTKQNEFEKAILAFKQCLQIANNFQDSKVKAECYDGIAYAYFRMNKYIVAKNYYEDALQINPSDSKLTNAHLLSAIGNCYHFSGMTDLAEYNFKEACKSAYSPIDICNVWNCWGLLKQQIGQYDSSLMFFEKARFQLASIDSGNLKQELLMNLGVLHFILNDTASTFKYFLSALKEADKTHDTMGKAIILLNRVRLFLELQQSDNASIDLTTAGKLFNSEPSLNQSDVYCWLRLCEAEKFYREKEPFSADTSLQSTLKRIEPDGNPFLRLSVLSALGSVKNSLKEYNEGSKMFQRVISFIDSTNFDQFEFKVFAYNGIAFSYEGLHDYNLAQKYYHKTSEALKEQIQRQMSFFSESDRTQYLESVQSFFDSPGSFALRVKDIIPEMCSLIYDNCLLLKGSQLSGTRNMLEAIRKESDEKTLQTYSQWQKLKKTLAFQYTLPYDKRAIDIENLEERANDLERELVKYSNAYNIEKDKLAVNWKSIRDKLKTKEAAIEFISFKNSNSDGTKSTVYCALILRPQYEFPKLIYLTDMHYLYDHLKREQNENNTTQIYRIYDSNLTYELIWKPLDSLLVGAETVYYSPVGLLHTVSFAAIRLPDQRYLSDKFKLIFVTSTRQIVFPDSDSRLTDISSAALFGGIYYTYNQSKNSNILETIGVSRYKLSYLKGTLTEILEIEPILRNNGIHLTTFKEINATEAIFTKEVNGKGVGIIHVSTHGFYFRELKEPGRNLVYGEQVLRHAENPLFRSGLLMAGVYDSWNRKAPIEETDDGFLTAYEVADTDLSNTKLAVLSACETGLGDIKGTEGVYGLQRAFKMAGVDYIIMSLWEVPDKQTTELMKSFYENWASGIGIREAFNNAQSFMRKKYDPYFWAAFVLSK
jgi:CHAT domain-containing protein/Tfp pilus assembly protein PilF